MIVTTLTLIAVICIAAKLFGEGRPGSAYIARNFDELERLCGRGEDDR